MLKKLIDKTICYRCKVKLNEYERKKNLYYDGTNIVCFCFKCFQLAEVYFRKKRKEKRQYKEFEKEFLKLR
jgi:hypothetical protein